MAINVGSVYMDTFVDANGFQNGVGSISRFAGSEFGAISRNVTAVWNEITGNTGSMLKELFNGITAQFTGIKSDIATKMGLARDAVTGSFHNMKMDMDVDMGLAQASVETGVTEMENRFRGLQGFLTGIFSNDWKDAWNGAKDSFGGTWEGIKTTLKTTVNSCIMVLNGFIAGIWRAVKGVVDLIGSLIEKAGELIGFSGWGFSMPEAPQIPFLARGGIVSQPTLAMIGERGKEAVLPLDNHTGWMTELANTIAAAITGSGAAPKDDYRGAGIARLYINGRQAAEAMIDDFVAVAGRKGIDLKLEKA